MKTHKYFILLILAGFLYTICSIIYSPGITAQEMGEPNQPISDTGVTEVKQENAAQESSNELQEVAEAKPQYNFVTEPHEILAGLQGVGVIVEAFQPEAKKYGLNEQAFRNIAESRLHQSGIKVLSMEQQMQTPGRSYLYVTVTSVILEEIDFAAVSITVKLNELISLWRNPTTVSMATTWEAGQIVLAEKYNLDTIKEITTELIDEFINAYLAANPVTVSTESPKAGTITGILYSEDKSFAIIGTDVVSEGQTIDGIKIVKIHPDKVEFEKDGKKWTQELGESPGPQWK